MGFNLKNQGAWKADLQPLCFDTLPGDLKGMLNVQKSCPLFSSFQNPAGERLSRVLCSHTSIFCNHYKNEKVNEPLWAIRDPWLVGNLDHLQLPYKKLDRWIIKSIWLIGQPNRQGHHMGSGIDNFLFPVPPKCLCHVQLIPPPTPYLYLYLYPSRHHLQCSEINKTAGSATAFSRGNKNKAAGCWAQTTKGWFLLSPPVCKPSEGIWLGCCLKTGCCAERPVAADCPTVLICAPRRWLKS